MTSGSPLLSSFTQLQEQLVAFDADPTVALARACTFTGTSGARWSSAEVGLASAWAIYQSVSQAFKERTVPPVVDVDSRPTPVPDALARARQLVTDADKTISEIRAAWDHLDQVRAIVAAGGPSATAAGELGSLLLDDPLGVTDAEIRSVFAAGAADLARAAAASAAVANLDADLAAADAAATALAGRLESALVTADAARAKTTWIPPSNPSASELVALQSWLADIGVRAASNPAGAASDLSAFNDSLAEHTARVELFESSATSALAKRDALRGLFRALHAKSAAIGFAEDAAVVALFRDLQERLWSSGVDLAAAEADLQRIANTISETNRTDPATSPGSDGSR